MLLSVLGKCCSVTPSIFVCFLPFQVFPNYITLLSESWLQICLHSSLSSHAFLLFNSSQSYPLSCKFFFTWLIHLPCGHFSSTLRFNTLCGGLPFSILFTWPPVLLYVCYFSTFNVSLILSLRILSLLVSCTIPDRNFISVAWILLNYFFKSQLHMLKFVWNTCHVATDISPEFSSNFRTLPDDITAHARQDSRQRHLEVTGVVVLTEEE